MVALAGFFRPTFNFALFGLESINVTDSEIKPYRSDGQTPAPNTAHVGSRQTGSPAITLSNSTVEGDVIVGVNGDPTSGSAIASSGSSIAGDKKASDEEVNVQRFFQSPPVPVEFGDPTWDVTLQGGGPDTVLDMPPGTGDVQITVAQHSHLSGAIVVTTPSKLAHVDVIKGVEMSVCQTCVVRCLVVK